ncbi:MAG: hypothetical protein RLZZ531_319 [Bacteroidota bacterium]|jgi:alpha-ketoglutarate-dependent taurine dioxygenase
MMKFLSQLFSPSPEQFSAVFAEHKVVLVDYQTSDLVEIERQTLALAETLGAVIQYEEDPFSGQMTSNHWTEIKYDPNGPNAYKTSNTYQPLHTDYGYFHQEMPVSFFYCVEQADFGGATTFFDPNQLVAMMESEYPTLLKEIQETKIHFGRNDSAFTSRTDFILQKQANAWKVNWNYYRAKDDLQNIELIERFKAFLDKYVEKSGELTELKLSRGQAVFFQDGYVLHGRNSFLGNRQLNKGAISSVSLEELKAIYMSLK